MFVEISEATAPGPPTSDPIHLVTQFYVPSDRARHEEIKKALRRNAENPLISSITLLNERVYSAAELGTPDPKIRQHVIGHRALFSELFAARQAGYTVVANADIFLDETLANLRTSDLHLCRKMYALLRYEMNGAIFGPRAESNDTWIVHSSSALTLKELALFGFQMGQPGCDNKICYLFKLLGFGIYNDPSFIRTYHCHASSERNYSAKVGPPYLLVAPAAMPCPLFGQSPAVIKEMLKSYGWDGNDRLAAYLRAKKGAFVVPRVAGIENHAAMLGYIGEGISENARQVLKNNAGVLFEGKAALKAYSTWYLKAFEGSDLYASWEPWSNYIKHIQQSHAFIQKMFPKPQVGAFVFDIFNFVGGKEPWTLALAGKRILVVSPCVEEARRAYPIDLFPGCSFAFLKPPMTQGAEANRGFEVEFADLCARVSKEEFDVALCSCGGYGNPLCAYIYSLGKSAIYVGGVLQMYFGIYGDRWLREQKDATSLYLTSEWERRGSPPAGFQQIENGCYW